MAKEVAGLIKLQIKGGAANPSPPVGPALGSKGINIMEFCKQFNARTQDKAGKILPVIITYYADKSFDFVIKTPPVAIQLLEVAKVKEYLEADLKNSDLGEYVSQVLIPTEKVYQVRNGKKIVKERSYLPGYVLVEAALVGEVAHHLRNTPNVIGFLGGSEKPVPLRQSEVNRILGTVDELQETGEELNIPYVVGETVKVTFGPFSGFSGIIEEVNSEKKKLKVMVKIFGRKTPLELGFMQVEKE